MSLVISLFVLLLVYQLSKEKFKHLKMAPNFLKLLIIALIFELCKASYDPCKGKGVIGSACDYDSDCGGFGVVCALGQCACHPYYKQVADTDGSKFCVKAPDTINASCTDTCRFPMFCNSGQCQCIRSRAEGKRCYVQSKLGDTCSRNHECTQPFSACVNGRCACIAGSVQQNDKNGPVCVAAQRCPDGGAPKGSCVRLTADVTFIQNQFNAKSVSTCPDGFFCYTSDVSLSGHCCPQLCPYNTQPDNSYSCSPGEAKQCPLDTHYCHRLVGQSFSSGTCCRRPCRDPTPVYINGKCYPRAWLGSPCTISEQCEAADGMQCVNGQCVCKQGYKPQTGSFITSENPPQQCIRDCASSLVSRGGECFSSVTAGQPCDVDNQCPANARCYRGSCFCKCDLGYTSTVSGQCQRLTTTTIRPVTNSAASGFLGLIDGLLKGGRLGG